MSTFYDVFVPNRAAILFYRMRASGQNGRMLLGTVKKGVVKKAPPPTAPKPLNLPSVKKENAGYDPKIALVPASGSTWSGPDASANPR